MLRLCRKPCGRLLPIGSSRLVLGLLAGVKLGGSYCFDGNKRREGGMIEDILSKVRALARTRM
jgi:hypothetical protein